MLILDALGLRASTKPYDPAIIDDERHVTFLALRTLVLAASARLRDAGLRQDRPVAIYVTDPILHIVLILALMREGVPSFSAHAGYVAPPEGLELGACVVDREVPHLRGLPTVTVDGSWLVPRLPAGGVPPRRPFAGDDALARIFASSGTTGRPKAIPMTVGMMRDRMLTQIMAGTYFGGRLVPVATPAATFGFWPRFVGLSLGQCIVLTDGVEGIVPAIERYAAAELRISVAQVQALLDIVGRSPRRLPSLRHVVASGSSISPSLALTAVGRLGCDLSAVYGSTEGGTIAVAPSLILQRQAGAAGFLMPRVQVEIVDEADRPLPPGREGIVRVRAPGMARGYLGDTEASAVAFRHGWFHPGDTGVLREDGLLVLLGRTSELINAGGVKTSPDLINEFLLSQPGIAEAAAFGFDLPGRATQIWAAVVAAPGFDERAVLAAARERLGDRAPVRLVRLGRLPRNAMGKVMVDALRREVAAL